MAWASASAKAPPSVVLRGSVPLPCPYPQSCLLPLSGGGGGGGGGISVLIRFYKNVLILCTITILCKDEICVEFKIFME